MLDANVKPKWARVRVGDVIARVIDRRVNPLNDGLRRYVGVDDLDSDELKLRRWGEVSDGQLPPTFRYAFPAGSVLFPTRRPKLRKCAIAPFAGITGEKILVLHSLDVSRLDPGFMAFLLASKEVRRWVVDRAIGSVTPHFRWRDLASYEFLLPPLDEQQRVAALLATLRLLGDRLFDLRVAADALLEADRDASFSDSRLTRAPLCAIASVRYGVGQPPSQSPNGLVMIRATNIDRGAIRAEDLMRVDLNALPESRRVLLGEGDILLVRSGAYTGDCALISKEWAGSLAGYDLVLRPDRSKMCPQYLAHYLLARRTVVSVLRALSARTAQPHLNTEDVGGIYVPCPDMAKQLETVRRLDAAQHCVDSVEARSKELRHMKAAAMAAIWRAS